MKWFYSVAVLVVAVLLPINTSAQDQEKQLSISAAPAIIDIAVKKSQTFSRSLVISNTGSTPIPIAIEAQSLFLDEPINITEKSRYDASSWIKLKERAILLDSDNSQEISFEVVVPDNASPGGHYATILLRALALETDDTTVVPELSVTLLITVDGLVEESLIVEPSNIFPLYGEVGKSHSSDIRITNSGNVHLVVAPELVFTHSGEEVVVRRLTPQLVLPGVSKQFDEAWKLPDEHSGYRAFLRLNYGDSRLNEHKGNEEFLIVGYSLFWLSTSVLLVWAGVYLAHHRKFLREAAKVLRHG